MSTGGPRMPDSWERYETLRAVIHNECCNHDRAHRRCRMLGRECEVLAPTRGRRRWRSPMSQAPRYVPPYMPKPFEVTDAKELGRAVAKWERAQEPLEESGGGRCTWFEKSILPILPEHLGGAYPLREPGEATEGDRDEGRRQSERPGSEQGTARAVRHQPVHHQRLVRRRPRIHPGRA